MDAKTFDVMAKSLAGSRSRRSLIKGVAAGLAVVAAGRVGLGGVSASSGVEQFVIDYYDAIQKHQWSTAYGILGSKFHQKQTLAQFTAGFDDTAYTSVAIQHVTGVLTGNKYGVDVVINAWKNDGSPQAFSGRYFIGREGGVSKIVDASIKTASTSGLSPLCQASNLGITLTGDAGTGHRFGNLTATNNGGACTLAGMPSVVLRDSHNHELIRGKRESGTTITAVPLESGDSALLQMDWVNWCGASVSGSTKLSVSLPGSTGKFTVSPAIGVPPCLSDPGGTSSFILRPWEAA